MEFGLFQGGFVHRDMRAANPNAEHDVIFEDLEAVIAADKPGGGEQLGDLAGVDLVILRLAAVDGFHVQRVPKNKRDLLGLA